jgi:transposase
VPFNLEELKIYLGQLRGKKILTFEETTTSQWLYTELKSSVDEIFICDPHRNWLLKEGAKTDKIDAQKLVQLLRANMLKPVFHSGETFIYLRKIVSAYKDLVCSGVRAKNQRAALYRSEGKWSVEEKLKCREGLFVVEGIDRAVALYEEQRSRYDDEFKRLARKHPFIGRLDTIPGVGPLGATTIAAFVVDPERFPDKGNFLSFSGLVRLSRISDGREYGKKNPRYNRMLKNVFKTAANSVLQDNRRNVFKTYYEGLRKDKGLAEHVARHAVARRIAVMAFGVMKSKTKFEAGRFKCKAA